MLPEIRPVPSDADLLQRCRLRRLQDTLIDLLRADPAWGDGRFYEPVWAGGPSLAMLNMEVMPEHAERIAALVREYKR
jgi:hypothetical protein